MAALFPIAIFGGIFLLIFFLRRRDETRIRDGFRAAGSIDARIHFWGGQVVSGSVNGRPMKVELYQGKNASHTTFQIPLAAGLPPFEMHLSSQGRFDRSLLNRGLEIDVIVGDPHFDPAVVVEAAPADLACAVLEPVLRQKVLERMPCTVHVENETVSFRIDRTVTDPGEVAAALAFTRLFADHVMRAPQTLEAQRLAAAQENAQAYRGMHADAVRAAMMTSNGAGELARLHSVRRGRVLRSKLFFGAFMIVMVVLPVAISVNQVRKQANANANAQKTTTPTKATPKHVASSAVDATPASNLSRATAAARGASWPSPSVHTAPKALAPNFPTDGLNPLTFCTLQAGIEGIARRSMCTAAEQKTKAQVITESDHDIADCVTAVESGIAQNRVELEAAAAKKCVQTTYDMWNARGTAAIEKMLAAEASACGAVFRGRGEVSAPCIGEIECASGLVCAGDSGEATCQKPGRQNEKCGITVGENRLPFRPRFGDTHQHDDCEANLACDFVSNVCQPRGLAGTECNILSPCADGLFCILDKCETGPRHDIGGTCKYGLGDDCKPGLTCDKTKNTCIADTPYAGLCN